MNFVQLWDSFNGTLNKTTKTGHKRLKRVEVSQTETRNGRPHQSNIENVVRKTSYLFNNLDANGELPAAV